MTNIQRKVSGDKVREGGSTKSLQIINGGRQGSSQQRDPFGRKAYKLLENAVGYTGKIGTTGFFKNILLGGAGAGLLYGSYQGLKAIPSSAEQIITGIKATTISATSWFEELTLSSAMNGAKGVAGKAVAYASMSNILTAAAYPAYVLTPIIAAGKVTRDVNKAMGERRLLAEKQKRSLTGIGDIGRIGWETVKSASLYSMIAATVISVPTVIAVAVGATIPGSVTALGIFAVLAETAGPLYVGMKGAELGRVVLKKITPKCLEKYLSDKIDEHYYGNRHWFSAGSRWARVQEKMSFSGSQNRVQVNESGDGQSSQAEEQAVEQHTTPIFGALKQKILNKLKGVFSRGKEQQTIGNFFDTSESLKSRILNKTGGFFSKRKILKASDENLVELHQEAKKELKRLRKTLKNAEKNVEKSVRKGYTDNIKKLEKDIESLRVQITSLGKEKTTFQTRLDEEIQQKENLLGEITKLSEEYNKSREELKVKNNCISELEQQMKEVQDTFNQSLEDSKKEITDLKIQLTEVEKLKQTLTDDADQLKSLQKATRNTLITKEKKISELEDKLRDLELDIGNITHLSDGRNRRIEELKSQLEKANSEKETAVFELDLFNARYEAAQEELKYGQEKISALEIQVSELELQKGTGLSADEKDKKIGELIEKLKAMKGIVKLAQIDKRELEKKIDSLNQKMDKKVEKAAGELVSELDRTKKLLEETEYQIVTLANEKLELQKENERLKTQIGPTDEEIARLIAQNASKNEIIAQLQKEMDDLNQQIEDKYMELDEGSFISEEKLPENENLSEEELSGNENPPSLSEAEKGNLIEMDDLRMQISELEKSKEQNTEKIQELVSREKKYGEEVSKLEEQLKDKDMEFSNIQADYNYLNDMLNQMTCQNKGGKKEQLAKILELTKQVKEKEKELLDFGSRMLKRENEFNQIKQKKTKIEEQLEEANKKIDELNSKLSETNCEGENSGCKDEKNCGEKKNSILSDKSKRTNGSFDGRDPNGNESFTAEELKQFDSMKEDVPKKETKNVENKKPNEPFVEGIIVDTSKEGNQDTEKKEKETQKPKRNGVETLFDDNGGVLPDDPVERQKILDKVGDELGLGDDNVEVTPESVAEAQKALDKEDEEEEKKKKEEKKPKNGEEMTIEEIFSEFRNQGEEEDEDT
ncbi:hypothetical protein KAW38_00950 [Candidatus Micrarchaeota archaeon]|nr:hypothetical protein [Candidatus Micrarchaeota archaeon]